MCAIQWFTPISGTFQASESVLAILAPILKHGPSPGPWLNAIASILFSKNISDEVACLSKSEAIKL